MNKIKIFVSGKYLLFFFLIFLVVGVIYFFGSYLLESSPKIKDLTLTNISDTSVTVAYYTETPSYESVIVSDSDNFNILSGVVKVKYFDDRNDGVLRTSHHITISGLKAESVYYLRVMGNIKEVPYTYPTIVTGRTLDSLRTPDPTYGRYILPELKSSNLKEFADALVFLDLNNGSAQSSLINAQGGFTFDKANIRTSDLSTNVSYKSGDQLTVRYISKDRNIPVSVIVGEDQPMRINEIKTSSLPNSLINPLNSSLIGTVNAERTTCGDKAINTHFCNNGIDYICDANQDGPNTAGWKHVGTCTPTPTPAPSQESNAGSGTISRESQGQQVASLTCGAGTIANGYYCNTNDGYAYNCSGSTSGNGTFTPLNTRCNDNSSGQTQTNTGSNSQNQSGQSSSNECQNKGYGKWCDGNKQNLLDCNGNGSGTVISCGGNGCQPKDAGQPDECKSKKSNNNKDNSGELASRDTCGPIEISGYTCAKTNDESDSYSGGVSCISAPLNGAETIKYCCKDGQFPSHILKKCATLEEIDKAEKEASELLCDEEGLSCTDIDIRSGGGFLCSDFEKEMYNKVSCCPSTMQVSPKGLGCEPKVYKTFLANVVGVNKGKDLLPYCYTIGTSCIDRLEDVDKNGGLQECRTGDGLVSNSEQPKAYCCSSGTIKYRESDNGAYCTGSGSLNKEIIAPTLAQSVLGTETSNGTSVNVNETGVYNVSSVSGYEITTKEVRVVNVVDGKAEIKFFNDINSNGVKDTGEEYITTPLEVKLDKQTDLSSYSLKLGWNLISWSMVDHKIKTGMDLLNEIANSGGYATHIATFRNGGWVLLSQRAGQKFGKDFDLIPNEGYFIKVLKAVDLNIEGTKISKDQDMFFSTGWNLIGYRSDIKSAKSFIDEVNKNTSLEMDTVTRFENSRYENLVKDSGTFYGNDFNIIEDKGYFVRLKKGGVVWKR